MCSFYSVLNVIFLTHASIICFASCDNSFFDWVDEKGNIISSYDTQRQYDDYLQSNLNSVQNPYSSWLHETFICFNKPISECLLQTSTEQQRNGKYIEQQNSKEHHINENQEKDESQKSNDLWESRKIRHLYTDSFALRNLSKLNNVNIITKDLKLLLLLVYEKQDLRNLIELFQNAWNLETMLYFTNTTETVIDIPDNGYLDELSKIESSLEYLYLCGTFNPSTASLIEILKPKFLSTKYLLSEYDLSKFAHLPAGIFTEVELGRFIKYSPTVYNFLHWQNVKKLGMAKSYLKEIPQELTNLGFTLQYLSLASNDLSSIGSDTVFPAVGALLELDLRFCQLKSLNSKFFDAVPLLRSVSLSGNHLLQSNHQNNLNFLKNDFLYFDLKLNPFSHIISVKYSSLELLREFSNYPAGFFLDLSYTYFKRCKSDSRYIKSNITHLSIINSFKCFETIDFSSLIYLEAVDASFNVDATRSSSMIADEIDNFFKRISNVRVLLFRENHLERGLISNPDLFKTNFKSLEVLHLGGNDLKTVPYHLSKINTLRNLNLSSNSIVKWDNPFVGNNDSTHNLKVDFSSNKITWITDAMEQDFYKFKEINLKDNVLQCNEQLQRLLCATESMNGTVKIQNMEETTCFHEELRDYLTLDQFRKKGNCQRTAFLSANENFNAKSGVNIKLLWISGIVLVCLILYAAWNWTKLYNNVNVYSISRNLQMAAANLPRFSKKKENGCFDFRYDVFVSYAGVDREWVLDRLVPNLETDAGIRICLHERDFQIGVGIMENIVDCIDKSHCLLLVISKSFVKSNWCLFEMNLGQYFTIESNKPNLILVLLEEIPRNVRPKVLSYLMRTRTYIEWPKYTELDMETEFFQRLTKALNRFKVEC